MMWIALLLCLYRTTLADMSCSKEFTMEATATGCAAIGGTYTTTVTAGTDLCAGVNAYYGEDFNRGLTMTFEGTIGGGIKVTQSATGEGNAWGAIYIELTVVSWDTGTHTINFGNQGYPVNALSAASCEVVVLTGTNAGATGAIASNTASTIVVPVGCAVSPGDTIGIVVLIDEYMPVYELPVTATYTVESCTWGTLPVTLTTIVQCAFIDFSSTQHYRNDCTLKGHSEFIASTPPLKYKTATFTGTWTGTQETGGCGGTPLAGTVTTVSGSTIYNNAGAITANAVYTPDPISGLSASNVDMAAIFNGAQITDGPWSSGIPYGYWAAGAFRDFLSGGDRHLLWLADTATHMANDPANYACYLSDLSGRGVTQVCDYNVTLSDEYTEAIAIANTAVVDLAGTHEDSAYGFYTDRLNTFVFDYAETTYEVHFYGCTIGKTYRVTVTIKDEANATIATHIRTFSAVNETGTIDDFDDIVAPKGKTYTATATIVRI